MHPSSHLAHCRSPRRSPRILVVDDQEDSRRMVQRVLSSLGYETELAEDGLEALAKLQLDIDLALLDAEMPGMDGFAVAEHIRATPAYMDLPIIMVTGHDSREDRLRAIEVGVSDFIAKPFEITELRLRSGWLLKLKEANDAIKQHRTELETTVEMRTAALRGALEKMVAAQREAYEAHLDTIRRLVLAAEYKDRDTAAHIERIGRYSEVLAKGLGLPPGKIEVIRFASPMHDVGKIGIADAILLKPGKLNQDEWGIMKQHTTIGAQILHGSRSLLLQAGEIIALSHHEKWNGSGYPRGLAGEDIPLEGRICAVADVFDALTSNRHYRDALSNETAYEMIEAQRGHHFDPRILDTFLAHRDEIEPIQAEYCDSVETRAQRVRALPSAPEGRQTMDVLMVDDDATVRNSLAKVLERAGLTVAAVEHGLAAFAELQQRPFKAIVCDIKMPFLGGERFYQQLEEVFPSMASRVVFVTACAGDDEVRAFLEQTGQPVLQKPVEFTELINVVRGMVEKGP